MKTTAVSLKSMIFALVALMCLSHGTSAQKDPVELEFKEGYALIYCKSKSDNVVTTEIFNTAFPEWIATLMRYAREGVVLRAHYMGKLKEGIFVVVDGEDRTAAMNNASKILQELDDIFDAAVPQSQKAVYAAKNENCQILEIGPIAVN